jgi:hypothetical protein
MHVSWSERLILLAVCEYILSQMKDHVAGGSDLETVRACEHQASKASNLSPTYTTISTKHGTQLLNRILFISSLRRLNKQKYLIVSANGYDLNQLDWALSNKEGMDLRLMLDFLNNDSAPDSMRGSLILEDMWRSALQWLEERRP